VVRFAHAGVTRAAGRAGGVAPAQRPSESGLDGRIQRALFDVLTARRVRAALRVPQPSVTSARPRGVFACATPPAHPAARKLGWLAKRNAFRIWERVLASTGHRGRVDARGRRA
jgi:hypothetical protein